MNSFTLVTGLWDIKRGELKDFHRSFDHYLESFSQLLSLDFNMVIYVPKELESFVMSKRDMKKTKIIIRELENFRKEFDFFKDVTRIREKHSWNHRADWLKDSPQAKLEYYNPIVMSKFFMVHDAMVFNPFNSNYFFWIDAGLTNTVDINSLKNLSKISIFMKKIKKTFLTLSFPYINDNEVHGFESKAFAKLCNVDQTSYVCRGGFFGGTKTQIQNLNFFYYDYLRTSLKNDLMGTEENILTMISYLHSKDVYRFELEDNGLVYPFFDSLDALDENEFNVKNSELIPWNRKKSVEDLKTSLYVLTFNSPQQFEKLLESYSYVDNNFLDKTRKILVDNSTDPSIYVQYQDICKKFGFEHIKKEGNIGICGGRQFVAEHFNESDSEYYIFFEDDMNLNTDTQGICESKYSTYIDGLYSKSLTIMHSNQYDYLKISFSEFYGNNKTQWAWYNIPQELRIKYFPDKPNLPQSGLDNDAPVTEIFREKRYKDLKYFEGEFHYCNWPLWMSRKGNRKIFLDKKWDYPNEQTWMSNVFQLQKEGNISCATLALSPIFHHRFDFYPAEDRKES